MSRHMIVNKVSKKDLMYSRMHRHGMRLKKIFNLSDDPIVLCKKLRRIEVAAGRIAVDYCNGKLTCEQWEAESDLILLRVRKIIGQGLPGAVFVNGDPRGYALKIDSDVVHDKNLDIHRDFGGYGILAPDYSDE